MTENRLTAYAKGVLGEDAACKYLESKGMVLLSRRYHSPYGEIDLVMQDGHILVIVEVKLRENASVEECAYSITPNKQRRLCLTARCYLAEHPMDCPVRFDALLITRSGILHIPNAFEEREW